MDTHRLIELTKRYVDLSNQRDLAQIQTMFAADSVYHSAFFGEYQGSQAIHTMMCNFFDRFLDAYWEIDEYRIIADNGVAFNFVMTGTDLSSGECVKRLGLEKIFFTEEYLIKQIYIYKV
ncbi:MAG: nuclear transport factor 2 family protein [Nitrosomonas sp.]